jgi:hypothetical protein
MKLRFKKELLKIQHCHVESFKSLTNEFKIKLPCHKNVKN